MKQILPAIALFLTSMAHAQTPAIQWQKSYGGSGREQCYSIQQTTDGGYITAGWANSLDGDVTGNHGSYDYWVVKTNSAGTLQWQKSYGGSGDDEASFIQQTNDGGYIVCGTSGSTNGQVTGNHGGGGDCWIVKLDGAGTLQWEHTYGGSGNDFAQFIQQAADGGYIVVGGSTSTDGDVTGNHGSLDYWVVKIDSAGLLQWQKSLGGSGEDEAYSVKQTTDGGYIIAGNSMSTDGNVTGNHGGFDYWVVKLNGAGTLQWEKSYGGPGNEYAYSIAQTSDGGYAVSGGSNSNGGNVTGNHGNPDIWVVKLSSTGALQWQKSYGGSSDDECYSIQQTTDKGYVFAGYSASSDGDVTGYHGSGLAEYWVVKTDSTGTLQWQKPLGGTAGDGAQCVQQTSDGGYIVSGSSNSSDGDAGGNHGVTDYWIVKLVGNVNGVANVLQNSLTNAYPNPVHDQLFIRSAGYWRISDAAGHIMGDGSGATVIPVGNWAAGSYFLYTEHGQAEKIIKK